MDSEREGSRVAKMPRSHFIDPSRLPGLIRIAGRGEPGSIGPAWRHLGVLCALADPLYAAVPVNRSSLDEVTAPSIEIPDQEPEVLEGRVSRLSQKVAAVDLLHDHREPEDPVDLVEDPVVGAPDPIARSRRRRTRGGSASPAGGSAAAGSSEPPGRRRPGPSRRGCCRDPSTGRRGWPSPSRGRRGSRRDRPGRAPDCRAGSRRG